MTNPLKIGVLTPFSNVYPYYGHHLIAGMALGIYPAAIKKNEIQFIPAYTKMGDPASTLEAVNRLVFFEQCDIISGLISYKSIPGLIPVLDRHNKLGFFIDMGECIPWFNHISTRVFYSSQQIWQSQYALGNWAAKEYGDGGMVIMSIYEAGYNISSTFNKGAVDAGVSPLNFHVLPYDKTKLNELNLDDFFDKLKKNPPPYVHAIFAGSLGNDFLLRWKNSGFHKNIPLVVVENMVYEDLLSDVAGLDLELISAGTWSRSDENSRNAEFVKRFERNGGQQANIFALLGYEAGLALREVKPLLLKRDWAKVSELLQKEYIAGPRGERNFYPQSGFSLPVTDIVSIKTSVNKITKTIIAQGKGLRFDADAFREIHEGTMSGWQNPYLCI
ncbi:MAG: ABC transporter substrate-binding protein [Bacteroidota bacterium]